MVIITEAPVLYENRAIILLSVEKVKAQKIERLSFHA